MLAHRGPVGRLACRRWIVAGLLALLTCANPFFPPTGEPQRSGVLRTSPVGAIEQLKTAYEKKSFRLFQDLFAGDKSFRFYVAPSLVDEFGSGIVTAEKIDTQCTIVTPGVYYYWGYDSEMRVHRNMFSQARQIAFVVPPPPLSESALTYHIDVSEDTLGVDSTGDSPTYRIVRTHDTTRVEVPLEGGVIELVLEDGTREEVGIGQQVFCVVPDPRNPTLWVIDKWFDLGN